MISGKNGTAALAVAGLTLYGSVLMTAALAGPQKGHKKPPVKNNQAAMIAAGKKVYDASGCKNCHSINGVGGKGAPDLTKVGANPKHTPKWLEEQVTNPKAHDADSKMPAFSKIKGKDLTDLGLYLASLKK